MSFDCESRARRQSQRKVGVESLARAAQIARIGRADGDVAQERTIDDADHRGVARRAPIARNEREIGIDRREHHGGRAVGANGEERVAPPCPGDPPMQGDLAPAHRRHADGHGRAPREPSRCVGEGERRQQRPTPCGHGVQQRAPSVGATGPRPARERDHVGERDGREGRRAHEPAPVRRCRCRLHTGQRMADRFRRPRDEDAALVRDLEQSRERAASKPLLLLDRAGDGPRRRSRRDPPPECSREERGPDDRRRPDHERDERRQLEPATAREPHRARGEQGDRRAERPEHAGDAGQAGRARGLALDEVEDAHRPGPLVTAYVKRFTPMRSAASCASGGSSGYVPRSSQPFPRSLSYE